MIKTLIGGIAVGIANIIPGVSGGTMLSILGIFNRLTEAITNICKPHHPNRMKDIYFLAQVLIGALIGLIGFAKILTFLFENYSTQTYFWFIGMVIFSIPIFLKSELQGHKINWLFVLLGMAIIFGIEYLNPGETNTTTPTIPDLNITTCLVMIIVGVIGGFSMLLPGVSGSMVLLIIGQYHLFRTMLSNVLSFQLNIIIPLGFMGIGILLGIVAASALTKWAMATNRANMVSFLLGLITASSIVLIPFDATYNLTIIISSVITLLIGGVMVMGIDKLS